MGEDVVSRNSELFSRSRGLEGCLHAACLLRLAIRERAETWHPSLVLGSNPKHTEMYTYYRKSILFKGPLLAITSDNISITTLSSLLSINIYKNEAKRFLIEQQSQNEPDEWPPFLLNSIPGLRLA